MELHLHFPIEIHETLHLHIWYKSHLFSQHFKWTCIGLVNKLLRVMPGFVTAIILQLANKILRLLVQLQMRLVKETTMDSFQKKKKKNLMLQLNFAAVFLTFPPLSQLMLL